MNRPQLLSHLNPALFNPVFILICLSSLFFYAGYHMLTPVVPLFLHHVGIHGLGIGVIVSAFMIASLVVRPWVGKWADEGSPKRLMVLGALLFVVTTAGYGINDQPAWLLLVRLLQGVGYAFFVTVSYSVLIDYLPADQKAEGLSYYSSVIKLSMAIAPLVGIWMAHAQGFPVVFWVALALTLVALLITAYLPAKPVIPHPCATFRGKLFNAQAVFPGLIMGTNSMVFGALISFLPMLAQEKGLENPEWFYFIYALTLIGSRSVTGKLSDTHGRNWVLMPGLLLVAVSVFLMAGAPNQVVFLSMTALYGLAAGTVQPSLMAQTADLARPGEHGSAMATFTALSDTGIAIGMLLMGSLGSSVLGYQDTLFWVGGVALLGFLAFTMDTMMHSQSAYQPGRRS